MGDQLLQPARERVVGRGERPLEIEVGAALASRRAPERRAVGVVEVADVARALRARCRRSGERVTRPPRLPSHGQRPGRATSTGCRSQRTTTRGASSAKCSRTTNSSPPRASDSRADAGQSIELHVVAGPVGPRPATSEPVPRRALFIRRRRGPRGAAAGSSGNVSSGARLDGGRARSRSRRPDAARARGHRVAERSIAASSPADSRASATKPGVKTMRCSDAPAGTGARRPPA